MSLSCKVLRAVIASILAILPSIVPAQTWEWFPTFRSITNIYPTDAGLTFFVDGAPIDINSACPNRFHVSMGRPNYETKVSAVIAAYHAGHSIKAVYDQADTGCSTQINRFQARPD